MDRLEQIANELGCSVNEVIKLIAVGKLGVAGARNLNIDDFFI